MIIDKIEPLALRIDTLSLVLCRVTTKSGLVGYGECLCNRPPMQQALVAMIRDAIAPLYLGKSVDDFGPMNLATRRATASQGRAGTVLNALAAVDMALWDIAGKATGQSVSAMLGGGARHARLPVMASLNKTDDKAKVRARLEQALASGVKAAKVHEANLEVIEEARRTVPASVPFVADCNNAHTLADIRRDEARWRALDLLWFEDPLWPPEDLLLPSAALPGIVLGMGADFGSTEQMGLYTKAPSVGVLQPDVCMLGGLTEARRALIMLAQVGKTAAPHTPFIGPAALASLHMLAVTEKPGYFATIEATDAMDMYGFGITRWQPFIDVPTGPGLGYDPDPDFLRRHDCANQ